MCFSKCLTRPLCLHQKPHQWLTNSIVSIISKLRLNSNHFFDGSREHWKNFSLNNILPVVVGWPGITYPLIYIYFHPRTRNVSVFDQNYLGLEIWFKLSFQITNMSLLPIKTWHRDSFSNVKHIKNILINIFVKYFCWGNAFIFTSCWKWTKSI